MKIRAIILSLFFLLPLAPAMAQDNDREPFPISRPKPRPTFNGYDANEFSKWVHEHKVYPEEAKKAGIEGRVYTQFTITKEGKLRLTCKLPWGGYPKSLHSLNMKNGRSDTPLS